MMTFAGENWHKIDPLREAYCLWTEPRLDIFRYLNLSKNQNEPLDSRLNVGIYLRKKGCKTPLFHKG
jgi:hypothetical protein